MITIKKVVFGILFCLLSFSVFAETEPKDNFQPTQDPYEKFNRAMFGFNEIVDKLVLTPIATLYNSLVPKPLNKGIGNFFNNIDTVPTVANDVLQGNFYQATSDAWRLGINSTVGILGFFDIATEVGLEPNTEDFGLTLAQWGYKNSDYLVLPFLGPTTPRDGVAFFINYYFLTIYPYIYPPQDRYRLYFAGIVDRRADLLNFQRVVDQAAVDKYVFMRDAFLQKRAYQIQRNKELGNPYLNEKDEEKKQTQRLVDS